MAKVSGSNLIRVFVAADLPVSVKKEIKRVQDEIRKLELLSGTYINHKVAHLTLKFIGYVEPAALLAVKKILRSIKFKPIDIRLSRLGAFGSKNFIKVIWIDVLSPQIFDLANKIEKELSFGKDKLQRPFQAHLTLVRVKEIKDTELLKQKLKNIKVEPIDFTIEKFALKQSALTPEGPIYIDLETYNSD